MVSAQSFYSFVYAPLERRALARAALLLIVFAALYCQIHEWFRSGTVALWVSLAWAMSIVMPWLFVFEFTKRAAHRYGFRHAWAASVLVAVVALLCGVALERLLATVLYGGFGVSWELHVFRRVPVLALALIATTLLLLLLQRTAQTRSMRLSEVISPTQAMPVCKVGITASDDFAGVRWIAAAGNYVELHYDSRTELRRQTMQQTDGSLNAIDWVRIHRSTFVRRSLIERVQRRDGRVCAVRLRCGTELAVGRQYAQPLQHAVEEIRKRGSEAEVPSA